MGPPSGSRLGQIVAQAEALISEGERVLATKHSTPYSRDIVNSALFHEWRASSLSFLRRVLGPGHTHSAEFEKEVTSAADHDTILGTAFLRAAKRDLEGGHLATLDGLATADVFGDFLEMAAHLLSEGYQHPAAVMVGSVLEEHLRKLCRRDGIDTEVTDSKGNLRPKKADAMNADLARAKVYSGIDQKAVTGWLAIRNAAAHGEYDKYSGDQVRLMLDSVVSFLSRVPY